MTVTIPVWALWTVLGVVGIPAVVIILGLACIGFTVVRSFK